MRTFAYGAFCLALWAVGCGSEDDKRTDPDAEAGAAGADASEGGSSSSGGDGNGEAGEGTVGLGGAPGGTGGTGGTEPGTRVSVTGQVVDRGGRPLAGVNVEVGGAAVTSNADGEFVAEAVVPYDIVVRFSETDSDVYLGVTRTDPKIVGNYSNTNRQDRKSV